MKIMGNIDRDILDVEGFQIDEIKSWKYIMIISFICSEIIILNRNSRLDDTRKVLNIIKNSLKKMRESNIPKILKTIYIQIDDEEEIPKFEGKLSEIGFSTTLLENINIKPIYIPIFEKKTLKQFKGNVLNFPEYIDDVSKSLKNLPSTINEQSISSLIKYIDQLNIAIDGKMSFNAQGIIQDLKDEYNWYNQKKRIT